MRTQLFFFLSQSLIHSSRAPPAGIQLFYRPTLRDAVTTSRTQPVSHSSLVDPPPSLTATLYAFRALLQSSSFGAIMRLGVEKAGSRSNPPLAAQALHAKSIRPRSPRPSISSYCPQFYSVQISFLSFSYLHYVRYFCTYRFTHTVQLLPAFPQCSFHENCRTNKSLCSFLSRPIARSNALSILSSLTH